MLSFFHIKKSLMEALLSSRKMNFDRINGFYDDEGDYIRTTLLYLSQIATLLNISLEHILEQVQSPL